MGKGHHSCGVAVCRNTSVNAKKRGLVIHFFRFPQDPDVKKEWIARCSRADKSFNPNNARICSDHFTQDDYEDSLKARIMGEIPMKLKKNAVPTLLLHPSKPIKQNSRPTKQWRRKKEFKETISEAPSTLSHFNVKIKSLEEEVLNLNRKLKENEESVQEKIESLLKENKELKKRLASKTDDVFKSLSSKNVIINEQSCDMELERRVSQFIASKVQIIVAELL